MNRQFINREHQAAQYIIEDMAERVEKQRVIQHLTDLMATIDVAYFKGRLGERNGDDTGRDGCLTDRGLWVHEGSDDGITIDLYDFGGDGKPVCEGLKPCTVTYDDGSQGTGWLYCMCYDPEDVMPLTFCFDGDVCGDIGMDPEDVQVETLNNIAAWLENAMQPVRNENKTKTAMADKTMTLVQAARQIEEGGTKIKVGNFESFDEFMSYFNAHYKPLIERLAEEWAMATDVRRFFTGDMLDAFSEN